MIGVRSLPLAKERCCPLETELCDKPSLSIPIAPECSTSEVRFLSRTRGFLLRKEVIQPQVPLRLPCYDFIPITIHTFGTCLPCGLTRRLRVQTAFMM